MSWKGSNWFGVGATLLTGALFAVSIDLGPVGPLALVAPVPLLLYAQSAPRAWTVGVAAAVARVIPMTVMLFVYPDIPLAVVLTGMAVFASMFAAVVLLARYISRALPGALAVFSYPVFLAMTEWLFGLVSPDGSFGSMGYSLVDVLPLLQVASIGGLPALTFCLALVPMTIAVAATRADARRTALIAGALPLVLALSFGAWRLNQPYTSQSRVALVGLDAHEARAYAGETADLAAARAFAAQVRALRSERPDYIVLPEKQLGGARDASAATAELAAAAADVAPATVIAGFDELLADGTRVNSAQVHAAAKPVARYLKRRFIPGLELGYAAGPESYVAGTRGIAICKDLDFPGLIRDYGRQGVELMLVPAWDFVRDGRMHSRMAVVRGVENGFAIARAAAAGRLTASDRYGRIIAEATTSPDRAVTVVTDLGLRGGGTLFVRAGDLFAWLCALGAIVLLVYPKPSSLNRVNST
jgi:apolipoprotein N-acyltransferase